MVGGGILFTGWIFFNTASSYEIVDITSTTEATATVMERDRLMNLPRRLRGELLTQSLRLMPRLVLDSVVSAMEVSATVDLVGSMVASGDTDMVRSKMVLT